MRRKRATGLVAGGIALALASCRVGMQRLDEAVFHEGPGYRLKVVRHYENLPLHYTGETYSVQCASPATRDFEPQPTQDAGWRMLERGGAIGSKRASDLIPRFNGRYLSIDESRLVWLDRLFHVTFDACGHFSSWDPTSVPMDWIDPSEKPDYCAPKGTADCRTMDFDGDRTPRYEDIHVEANGRIRFVARTPAFRNAEALQVASDDFGSTWKVEPILGAAPKLGDEGQGGFHPTALRFAGEVTRGAPYEREVGPDLVFRLVPSRGSTSGWTIFIGPPDLPAGEHADYLSVVTPPYRSRNPRYLDTSYGVSARESVAWTPRSFFFVGGAEEYREAAGALAQMLWPERASPEEVGAAARRHEAVWKGRGELRILDSRLSAGAKGQPEQIEWLKFEVVLDLPVVASTREGQSGPAGSPRSIREMSVAQFIETRLEELRPQAAELEDACGDHDKAVTVSKIEYGDLDGDGNEEAVFQGFSCLAGNAGVDTFGVVKLERDGRMRELPIADVPASFRGRDPREGFRDHIAITVEDGRLVETFPVYRGDECEACASGGRRKLIFGWKGDELGLEAVADLPPDD